MIPEDCIYHVADFVPHTFHYVNREFYLKWKNDRLIAISKLQRWYRIYRLIDDTPPYPVTRRTMIRYYITKYKKEWIQRFPRHAILKLDYLERPVGMRRKYMIPTRDMLKKYTRTFISFVYEYNLSMNDFFCYGW